jgi:hypothetical protein
MSQAPGSTPAGHDAACVVLSIRSEQRVTARAVLQFVSLCTPRASCMLKGLQMESYTLVLIEVL